MSMSLSQPSSGTATNAARQQLDELDALLQRMLELPVNRLENLGGDQAEQPSPLSYTADEGGSSASVEVPAAKIDFQALKQQLAAEGDPASAVPAASGGAEKDDNWVPLSSTWQPSALTWKPLAESWKAPEATAVSDAAATDSEPVGKVMPAWEPVSDLPGTHFPTPAEAPVGAGKERTARIGLAASPADRPLPFWVWPLVWFNDAFDGSLTGLGPVGRFLRSRSGRLSLGFIGLGCLVVAAVVLLIDWIGWTS